MRPAAYVVVLLATALLSGVVAYVGVWTVRVGGCHMLDRSGTYLAYCDTPAFGSYEHEAYAMGFEPAALRAMQSADALFLGNSRLQFAFSAPNTARYFQGVGKSFHLLGFGYGESSAFPRLIFARSPPHPKVVVINADPFFQPVFSPAAWDMLALKERAWIDATLKKAFGRALPWLCRIHLLCSNTIASTYRDTTTGEWLEQHAIFPPGSEITPITATKAQPLSLAALPAWVQDARLFLAALPVPPACVFLVGVPTPHVDAEGMARALGGELGLHVIEVPITGLESPDHSHLTAASADRWSAAFFTIAAPAFKSCL